MTSYTTNVLATHAVIRFYLPHGSDKSIKDKICQHWWKPRKTLSGMQENMIQYFLKYFVYCFKFWNFNTSVLLVILWGTLSSDRPWHHHHWYHTCRNSTHFSPWVDLISEHCTTVVGSLIWVSVSNDTWNSRKFGHILVTAVERKN